MNALLQTLSVLLLVADGASATLTGSNPLASRSRKLTAQLEQSLVQLPPACNSACPNAETATASIQASIMQEITSNPSMQMQLLQLVSSMQDAGSGSSAGLVLALPGMKDFIHTIVRSLLDGMCTHKEAFQCVATNSNICVPSTGELQGFGSTRRLFAAIGNGKHRRLNGIATTMANATGASMRSQTGSETNPNILMGLNPADLAPMLGCVCDACPSTRHTIADIFSDIAGRAGDLQSAFGEMSSGASDVTDTITNSTLFELACPLIHTVNLPCFTSHEQCNVIISQIEGGLSPDGTPLTQQLSSMVDTCNSMGFTAPTSPPSDAPTSPPSDEVNAAQGVGGFQMMAIVITTLTVGQVSFLSKP